MGPVEDHSHSSLLESLPARPPTPPREALSHDLDVLSKQLIAPQQLSVHLRRLQTPPGVLSPTTSSKDSTARRKRVGFSCQAQYQDAPIYTDPPSRRQNPTPVSLPSSTSRPVKGILKPTVAPNGLGRASGVYLDIDKPGQINIADMLESTLQQLAGADRESKIDAYTMLFRALKASSNLPDRIALHEKMGLFMQFIQRDLTSKASNGTVDILLVVSALKLLHTFLCFQGIASSIPNEFAVFLVDHCVRSFEDEQASKEVVKNLMQTLFFQNFPPEVMTFDRMGRLINALHDIENHMRGKSIIQGRIHVYEKLVNQCPQQMAVHSDWLQDMLTDMLSSAAEIRGAATKFGLSAAFTLNKDKRVVSRVLELLNLSLADKKYVEHITERLDTMLQHKEECLSVPRIWSVISLLIPSLDQWDYFKSWFNIIQLSFNNPNLQTKREANLAWSRFAYRMFLDHRLDQKSALKLVEIPLLSQLRRKGLRDSVLGAIRNFFYYALRPDANLKALDEIWDLGVTPLMQRLIEHEQEDHANIAQAAAILTGLIDCKTRRVWSGDRIKNAALIKDDELPAMEPRWIRANSTRVFALVAPILERGFAEVSVPTSQSQTIWRALVHSVASASAKDVKLHDDTAKFVARTFSFLLKVWNNGPTSTIDGQPCSPSQFLNSSREFILILEQGLGLLPNPFLDKQLVRTKEEQFILYSSSSHRLGKNQASKRPPLHHLFLFLSHLPAGVPDDDTFARFFISVFSPFFQDKTEKAQADLAQELLRALPLDAYCPYGPWAMCARKISATLEPNQDSHQTSSSGSGGNLGPEFREFTRVLERGLRSAPNLPWEHWSHFFQALCSHVRTEVGHAGVAIAVVEPLAVAIKDLVPIEKADAIPSIWVEATIELVAASTQPRDRQAVDAARRRLWGTSNAGASRGSSSDPFDHLYKLLLSILEISFANVGSCGSKNVSQLLDEIRGFFDRGNSSLVLRALATIQSGLVCWLQDEDHRITKTEFPGAAEAVRILAPPPIPLKNFQIDILQTRSLWQRLCGILIDTSALKLQLGTFEPLFCAAFRSTHRETVRIAAETWNQVYENVDHIEYPETLQTVLASLGSSVDIARPGLDIVNNDAEMVRSNFTELQEEGINLHLTSPARPNPRSHLLSRRSATPGSAKAAETIRSREGSARSTRATPNGRTPKPKLRHEDSQLQFTAIESSPAHVAQESQVITDRQKEVRERQRETVSLFPEMRSSPTEKTKKARSTNAQQPNISSGPRRAATPEQDHGFDDCLTSTPTPRRGQPVLMPDQDQEMTDPPSSPPEPRGFRLLAELKSQCNRATSLDDWQFSSSPVSGSPNLAPQSILASQSMDLDDVDEGLLLDGDGGVAVEARQDDSTSSQLDVIEDATILDQIREVELSAVEKEHTVNHQAPITPSGRILRSGAVQVTPRSDNDEFVDALSSPLPPTPSQRLTRQCASSSVVRRSPRNTANSQSFNISASFETGLRNVGRGRIEIPLRSSQSTSPRKKEFKSYRDILPESPEQALLEQPEHLQEPAESEALGTIEVGGASAKKSRRGRPKKTRRASGPRSSQPSQSSQGIQDSQVPPALVIPTYVNELAAAELQESYEDVSPGSGKWWRKRKRSVSSVHSSGGSKRARHDDLLVGGIQEEIPGGQTAAAVDEGKSTLRSEYFYMQVQALTGGLERQVAMQTAEELYQNDVSFISNEGQSPVEQSPASPELPCAADERFEDHLPESEVEFSPIEGHREEDMAGYTDDEEAVQSQLAREEEQASADRESRLASRAVSPAQHELEPNVPILGEQPAENTDEVHQDAMGAGQEPQRAEPELELSKFDSLMATFRSGLVALRSVNLTREQYYQAEDILFEVKREMLEAERRGRK